MSGIDLKSGANGKAPVIKLNNGYDMPVVGIYSRVGRDQICRTGNSGMAE